MRGLAFWFMALAVVSALIGMIWGIQMSATQDHTLAPAHGHLNLLGWVSCSVFAFYYTLVPEAGEGLLPRLHLGLTVVMLGILPGGISLAILDQSDVLAKLGSVLAVLAMLVFGVIFLRSSRARSLAES